MQLDPRAELLLSRCLAALRPVLIGFMVANAVSLSGGQADALSFCNVLFVGNFSAAVVVILWFRAGPILSDLRALSRRDRFMLIVDGAIGALTSSLIYTGLSYTSSTNAILLGRLAPVLYALLGALVLGQAVRPREWFGFGFILSGTLLVALIGSQGNVNKGDALILASTLLFAIASVFRKVVLGKRVSLRALIFSRNASSSIIFFVIASVSYGSDHFADAFRGELWLLMGIYALVVIVIAQFLWFDASRRLGAISIGRWATPAPAIGVLAAALLNQEWPNSSQISGLLVIMIGVLITAFAPSKANDSSREQRNAMDLKLNSAEMVSSVT
ncbi:MAG: DMT family transporter [Synechococcus sp.]